MTTTIKGQQAMQNKSLSGSGSTVTITAPNKWKGVIYIVSASTYAMAVVLVNVTSAGAVSTTLIGGTMTSVNMSTSANTIVIADTSTSAVIFVQTLSETQPTIE